VKRNQAGKHSSRGNEYMLSSVRAWVQSPVLQKERKRKKEKKGRKEKKRKKRERKKERTKKEERREGRRKRKKKINQNKQNNLEKEKGNFQTHTCLLEHLLQCYSN
jgi:hypothetical protein